MQTEQQQADTLMAEFEGFQVWTDFRLPSEGGQRWHARREGWPAGAMFSAPDSAAMRVQLAAWTPSADRP